MIKVNFFTNKELSECFDFPPLSKYVIRVSTEHQKRKKFSDPITLLIDLFL